MYTREELAQQTGLTEARIQVAYILQSHIHHIIIAFVIFKVWFSNRRARLRKHVVNGNTATALGFPALPLGNMTCQYSSEAIQYDWRNAQLASYNSMFPQASYTVAAAASTHQGVFQKF